MTVPNSGFRSFFSMDKSVFSFVDKRLNADTAATARRLLTVGAGGLHLAVLSEIGEVWALQAWHFQRPGPTEQHIRMVMGQEPVLQWTYKHTSWAWAEPQATLVPRRLFHPDHLSDYFQILLPAGGQYHYGYESLSVFDCFLVYAIETSLHTWSEQHRPSGDSSQHLAGALLQNFHHIADFSDHQVFVHFRFQSLQIAVFERRNLLFFNSFEYQHANDALYYVLLAYEQFKLNPLDLPLMLSGSLVEDSEIFRQLKRYFRTLRFSPLPSSIQLPQSAVELPAHYWFEVFSLL